MGTVIERRNPSGKIVYGIRWTSETGVDCKKSDRSWTKAMAKAELSRIEEKLRQGVATRVEMTVTDLFAEWRDNHVRINCSPARMVDVEIQFRLRIAPMIGHRPIDTVNRRMVKQMVSQMRKAMDAKHPGIDYAGNATINKTLSVIKGMFTYAVDIDQVATNPAHGVPELPLEPQRQISAWPLKAVTQVATNALALPNRLHEFQRSQQAPWCGQRDFTFILLAALTGMRQSELFALRWDQIDDHWIHVTHKLCRQSFTRRETKSRRGRRRIPLLPAAIELLQSWREVGAHNEIVFPNHAGTDHIRASNFTQKVWDPARKRAGIVEVNGITHDCSTMTFHELRHTFISLCLAAGRDLWEVANWAGDDPDVVKDVYGHYLPDSLGDTSRLARIFDVKTQVATLALPVGDKLEFARNFVIKQKAELPNRS